MTRCIFTFEDSLVLMDGAVLVQTHRFTYSLFLPPRPLGRLHISLQSYECGSYYKVKLEFISKISTLLGRKVYLFTMNKKSRAIRTAVKAGNSRKNVIFYTFSTLFERFFIS